MSQSKDERNAYVRAWRLQNPGKSQAASRKWREANQDYIRAGRTKEESREYARAWRAANPTKYREYNRKYREANVEHYKGLINAWAKANRAKIKDYHLKATYGITFEQKTAMLAAQGGKCGICRTDDPGTSKGWQIDADHSVRPAKIRGILCKGCNTSLGSFNHDPVLLNKAIEWLRGGTLG